MAHTIVDVPIFKVGLHNNKDFLHSDLQEMVDSFNEMRKENPDFEIPVKIGHPDNLDSETPAVAWMKNLRVDGDFIKADFYDLSDESFDLIKSKQFKNRSIEIMNDFVNSMGTNLGKVISGIALLGSSLPAINLPDIKFKSKLPAYALQFAKDNSALIEQIQTEAYEAESFAETPKTEVQTVICMKSRFKDEAAAKAWIKSNKFSDNGVDETDNSYRFRQRDPGAFEDKSFRTISLTDGVSAVIGKPKDSKMAKESEADEMAKGSVSANGEGVAHAKNLIAAGKVDHDSAWSMSADDENKILGSENDWGAYKKWFLGIDTSAAPQTKGYYKYPFGKDGKVYRRAVIAAKSRAAQSGASSVEAAADRLLADIDKDKTQKDKGQPENHSKKIANKQKEEQPMDEKSTVDVAQASKEGEKIELSKKSDAAESLDAAKAKLLDAFKSPDEIVTALKAFESSKAEIEKLRKEQLQLKTAAFKKEVEAFSQKMIEDKRLLPKHREIVNAIMFSLSDDDKHVEFEKEFGKKEKATLLDAFKHFLSTLPEHGLLATFAHNSALTDRQESLEAFWKSKGITPEDVKKMDADSYKRHLIEFERKRAEVAKANER